MDDNLKTKAQLISEVQDLRRRVARLEGAESERRYRTILETTQEAIWVVDAEAKSTYVNQHLAEMLGYTRDELLGRSVFDFVDDADRAETRRYLERGKSGIKEQHDFRFRRKDGAELWTIVSTAPLFDGAGSFVGGLAMLIDVTERRRSEEALRKSEERWRTYIEQASDLIFILDKSGRIVSVNNAACATTGFTVEELLGKSSLEFVVPEQRDEAARALRSRLAGVPVERIDFEIFSKDGVRISLEVRGRTQYDEDQVSGAFEIARDITDRKRAEEELAKTQERLQHVLSFSPAIIYLHKVENERFKPQWVSDSLIRLTGYELADALSEGWWMHNIHPEDRGRVLEGIQTLFERDHVVLEYRFRHNAGGYLWLRDEIRLLRDESGNPLEAIGSWVDVTERREAEVALRDSEERFRTLVSSMDDMVFTVDVHQRHTGAFGRWIERFGMERRDLIGRTAREIFGADSAPIHEYAYPRALAGEQVVYDWSMIRAEGTRHFQTSLSPIRDQSGKVTALVGVGRDTTESKRAEQALRESQTQMRAILDNCPALIFQKDLDGRYLQFNRRFERFNLPPEQVLGRTDDQLFAPEIAASFVATDREVIDAGCALEFEETAVSEDGLHVYLVHKFPLLDPAGNVYAVGGISTDITARKRAEDDLRKQKEILQKIFDHIPVMIRFLDENGRVKLVNREWERILGWSLEEIEMRGLDIFSELYPDPEYRQTVLSFIAASTGEFTELKMRVRNGGVIDTAFANVRLEDGTNIGIGRDITESKRAADLLARQTAQLAALHEIDLEISAESDLSRILEVVTIRAAELLGASDCSTYIRDRDEAALTTVASLNRRFLGLRLEENQGLAGRAFASGEVQMVDDYGKWPGRTQVFDCGWLGPAIAAPLKWQQTVIGAIALYRKRGREPFTDEDATFLKGFAADAAIAIHQTTLFEEIQEGQRRLQVLSHRLIDAQEAERKRLARELHDQIGQALTAVQISLQTLQPTHDTSGKVLEDSLVIIDEAIQQVHDLSLDLRPSLLDDLGLVAALRWYVGRVASRAGLEHRFKADVATRLAPEVETACFRIAQEALTNVLRHASATNVSVEVTYANSDLRLLVRDNGVGFDVRAAMRRTGLNASLGLQGMQERAAAIGGRVDIRSKPRRGTKVQATLSKRAPAS